jgi:hypothetical protein
MIEFLVHFNERFLLALKFISERVLVLVQDVSIRNVFTPSELIFLIKFNFCLSSDFILLR